jgi:uncharacterized CHY-type Zn-finger protein
MNAFKDSGHIFRLAAVFIVGVAMFVALRTLLVPRSFGKYGHYRGDAIGEIASRPVAFAGHQACEDCHADVLTKKTAGKHARVACEACHGALASHAADPASVTPNKLDAAVLCARCHQANAAKPATFPQVQAEEHSAGIACDTCHQPHSPVIVAEGKK